MKAPRSKHLKRVEQQVLQVAEYGALPRRGLAGASPTIDPASKNSEKMVREADKSGLTPIISPPIRLLNHLGRKKETQQIARPITSKFPEYLIFNAEMHGGMSMAT